MPQGNVQEDEAIPAEMAAALTFIRVWIVGQRWIVSRLTYRLKRPWRQRARLGLHGLIVASLAHRAAR